MTPKEKAFREQLNDVGNKQLDEIIKQKKNKVFVDIEKAMKKAILPFSKNSISYIEVKQKHLGEKKCL